MRRAILIGFILALFVAIIPAAAQDEEEAAEPVACTAEQFTATTDGIKVVGDGLQEIISGMGDGSDPAALTNGVIGLQALSTGYWNELYPEIPNCIEASAFGYNFGVALDETLISISLARLALFEKDHGDATIAASYADYAKARGEWYAEIVKNTFGKLGETGDMSLMTGPELPACTEDDMNSDGVKALQDSLEAYKQVGTVTTADVTPEQLTALIGGYAAISGAYWTQIYPALPACYELSTTGYNVGLVYNESVITLTLSRLAMYEAEFGDADAATALSDGATARQELFEGFVASAFPQEEAAATEEAE